MAPVRVAPAAERAEGEKPATAQAPVGRWEDEPPSGGWDAADTVTSGPDSDELPVTPRNVPAVKTATAALAASPSPGAAPAPTASPGAAAHPALGAMRPRYETSPGVGGPPPVQLPATGNAPAPRGTSTASATPAHAATAHAATAHAVNASASAAITHAATAHAATATSASGAGLGTAMREEVWAIVRAAVEEAMGPLVARQRELEARVERAEREHESRARAPQPPPQLPAQASGGGAAAGSTAAARLASIASAAAPSSIPVAFGPSLAPPAFSAVQPAVPRFDGVVDGSRASAALSDTKVAAAKAPMTSAHPVGPRPSISPTGYGVSVTTASRASLDLAAVGPVDIEGFDGGRRKKRVAGIVVVMMLLVVVGAITMTLLSHS